MTVNAPSPDTHATVQKARHCMRGARLAPMWAAFAAVLVVYVFWSNERAQILSLWLVAMMAIFAAGQVFIHSATRVLAGDVSADTAINLMNCAMLITTFAGSSWGVISAYLYLETGGYVQALTLLTPCLISAASVPLFAGSVRVTLGSVLPALLIPAAVTALWHETDLWIASMGIIFLIGAICVATALRQEELLTRLFEHMLEAELANSDLGRAHARYRDVQEAARAQLEQRAREAEAGEVQKLQFIARASHDLRQPLSALQYFIEVAQQWHTRGDRTKVDDILEKAVRSASTLSERFTGILDIARYSSGEYRPRHDRVDIAWMVREIEDQLGPLAAAKGIAFRVRLPRHSPVHALTDSEALWRVLSNLVSNAIKFTPPSTSDRRSGVLVAVVKIAGRLRLEVFDTGRGIAKRDLDMVWEPFCQGPSADPVRTQGLGLGLSIVRAICYSLGHDLSFRSELGKGSRFSVELPLCDPPPGDMSSSPFEGGDDAIRGISLLLLEDDRDARESLAELLSMWGVRVLPCSSTREARAHLEVPDVRIDAIITDYALDEAATGFDAIEAIRNLGGQLADVPAIVTTGNMLNEVVGSMQLQRVRVLQKPVKPVHLRRALSQMLSGALVERYENSSEENRDGVAPKGLSPAAS